MVKRPEATADVKADRMVRTTTAVVCVLAALVAMPQAQGRNAPRITTPKEQFGHDIGDDYFLVNYTQYVEYLQKLDRESDRMTVVEIGKTEEGRTEYTAIITSPENHKKLAQFKEMNRRLALADGLTDDQARQLARDGKTVVWIDGGLHATEVLGAQQLIETIYRLNSATDPETHADPERRHRPAARSINPDGMELVSNWYMREPDEKQPLDRRRAAAVPEVHRPRQQPRLLHDEPVGEREREPDDVSRVVSRRSCTTTTRPGRPARCCSRRRSAIRSTTTSIR